MNTTQHDAAHSGESHSCVKFSGNLQASDKVVSAITWLLDACVETKLIPATLLLTHDNKDVIAQWEDRDVKRKTADRHRTGGGITDVNFWTELMANLQQSNGLPQASIHQVFTDFGSEFFFQGFLCALMGDFKEVVGIELNPYTFGKSVNLAKCLMTRARRENKFISKMELHHGDFLNHDAILAITMRSTVVHANNVVFTSNTNMALVDMWRKHLPAGATIVLFDETAILSSGNKRSRRSQETMIWATKQRTISTSVSWQPSKALTLNLWQVSKEYTELRDWAKSAEFIDLWGWAICHGKAQMFHGVAVSVKWMENFVVFTNFSELERTFINGEFQLQAQSIVLVTNGTQETYKAECEQVSNKFLGQSSRATLDALCVLDNSDPQHPVVNKLAHIIMRDV